jgi:hypothetical protein
MANQPFDTTIINPLERPKSSDINAAQSEIHRDLRDYLFRAYAMSDGPAVVTATAQTGFVGRGFVVEPTSPASMDLTIAQGIGFQATNDTTSAVGSIVGLNDLSYYKPLLLSGSHVVTVPTAPAAGFCRRDLIEVRYNRALTDATASDVYNVVSNVFTPQTINKTMTFDLVNDAVQYIPAGSPTAPTASIVYRSGVAVAYSTDDSFLSATIPSTDSGYVAIAVINVGPSVTSISTDRINDNRPILSTNNVYEVVGSATLGGADASALPLPRPAQLSNVKLRVPAGMRAAITKANAAVDGNQYTLTLIGNPAITDIAAFFTITSQGSTILNPTFSRPVVTAIQSRSLNVACDAAKAASLVSVHTKPYLPTAIGQILHTVTFTVGVVAARTTGSPVTAVDMVYVTDVSDFTSAGSATETVDTSFNIKVAV